MDKITRSFVEEYSSENDLDTVEDDKKFEYFANYIVTSSVYTDRFEPDSVSVAGGNDAQIDGIAIIVNGVLIEDKDEVADLAQTNGYIEAHFVFVQAKRSSNFDMSSLGLFGFGVKQFFSDSPQVIFNAQITEKLSVMNEIYNRSSKFKSKPTCGLFYVSTGKWVGDTNLNAIISSVKSELDGINLFSKVEYNPIDADLIHKLYKATKNSIVGEITFSDKVVMPEIPGVTQAYLGYVPALEFLKLIEDENGNLIKSLFYDNVRDWQEYNKVNSEMRDAIQNSETRLRFILMNNGITIIAKDLEPVGNKFHLTDYQIVNGCQTSNVLFDQKNI